MTRPFPLRHACLFLLAAAPLISACASTSPSMALPDTARVIEMPYVHQGESYACGLVAMQSLCGFWGVTPDAATLARLGKRAQEAHGLSGAELRTELEALGFETFLFRGKLDHSMTGVFRHLDLERPPLLMLSLKPDHGHFVLCVGYDEAEQRIYLLDPARGRTQMSYENFEQAWERTEQFLLLAIPRATKPALATKAE